MASFTSTGWVTGETVSVFAVSETPPYGATGSAVTTATANSDGAAAFTGLTEATPYLASGGTSGRAARFQVPVPEGAGVTASISGDPTVGQTLTVTVSDIVTSPTYQWNRDGVAISGETGDTYEVAAEDVGLEITCTVDGSVSVVSDAVVGSDEPAAPANTVAPVASGSASAGSLLTRTTGTWTGSPTPTFGTQWRRDGVSISGETGSTYTTVDPDDVGAAIDARVTATNTAGSASADSNDITVTDAVDELFPGYYVDQEWDLDVASADANFALTNMERGTDPEGSVPAVFLTAAGTLGLVLTADDDIPNVRVTMKFRPVALGVFDISNVLTQLLARRTDINNEWRGQRGWGSGELKGHVVQAGSLAEYVFQSGLDTTDTTTLRWQVLDVIEDEVLRTREWADGDTPPAWLTDFDTTFYAKRAQGSSGFATTSTTTADVPLTGKAGVCMRFGGYVHSLNVKKLARTVDL